jgi:NAD(P)-dependent dehydrogenase (short-subunit alcohol dehydrogenase family)
MNNSKRIFITGASSGFGYETSKALAQKGHTVYAGMRDVSGKNAEKAQELERWAKEAGYAVHILEVDVTDEASINKAVSVSIEKGGIDVLINNAGIGTWGIDEGYTTLQAEQVFDVNLFGMMRMNRAIVPHFRAKGNGLIIYISSGLGRIVLPFMGIYTASKFAVEGYAETVNYELAPLGIQSVIIEPGAFDTPFMTHSIEPKNDIIGTYGPTEKMLQAFGDGFDERAETGGFGNPAEVVNALVEEVERTHTTRPLRRPVGQDVLVPVSTINKTCDEVQNQLLANFGLK